MSVVTGVVLCTSLGDEDETPILISNWLKDRGFSPLLCVEGAFGGSKHPQMHVSGAGFNYFPEDDFSGFVLSLPWQDPENVVLVLQPEDGPTRVFRPNLNSS